ncbi:MAG: M56 family metallopeptidase, partial [Flavitalea sp.]
MPQLLEYLVKLSGALMIVYLFYWLVLSRLTFYTSNRWYLLSYSLIAFFIPLVDITPILEQADLTEYQFIDIIPVIEAAELSNKKFINSQDPFWNAQNVLLALIPAGMILMVVRFVIQYFSMLSIRRASQILSDGDIKIYHTDKNIIPFSFGDSIFINKNKHTPKDLSEIIRHEFIHVKQKHTVDILFSEWICILNWYNPFAWLIRHDIRQNLEFIADDKVLQNGIEKKEYQYILLKVVGIHKFGIATNFNYASLKK